MVVNTLWFILSRVISLQFIVQQGFLTSEQVLSILTYIFCNSIKPSIQLKLLELTLKYLESLCKLSQKDCSDWEISKFKVISPCYTLFFSKKQHHISDNTRMMIEILAATDSRRNLSHIPKNCVIPPVKPTMME